MARLRFKLCKASGTGDRFLRVADTRSVSLFLMRCAQASSLVWAPPLAESICISLIDSPCHLSFAVFTFTPVVRNGNRGVNVGPGNKKLLGDFGIEVA
jgi:hypothetical protein